MARPRGKLFALLVVFVAIGLATATGAFTSVSADRTATVNVAGDGSALLALDPADDNNQEEYVSYTDGQIEFTVDDINSNATTDVGYVFNVTNNGEDDVTLTIDDSDLVDGNDGDVVFYSSGSGDLEASNQDDGVTIASGESIQVGMQITVGDIEDLDGADDTAEFLSGDLTINATTTA